jgi:predicted amidophosphoribosyltransferase
MFTYLPFSKLSLFDCPGCSASMSGSKILCPACLNQLSRLPPPPRALVPYQAPITGVLELARKDPSPRIVNFICDLFEGSSEFLASAHESSLLACVPSLAKEALIPRLVLALGKRLKVKTNSALLEKNKLHRQHGKSERERVNCPRFIHISPSAQVQGEKILIIDDVCTSGVSLEQSAIALLRSGSLGVKTFTLAKTQPLFEKP